MCCHMQEYMQLSVDQVARIATLGINLFAQLRTLNAQIDTEVSSGPSWHLLALLMSI